MKTKLWAIGLMFLTTLLTSTAQIFYKAGVNMHSLACSYSDDTLIFLACVLNYIFSLITTNYIIMGLLIYAAGAIIMIIAFKGGELSVLYPIIATSYIWVAILSLLIYHDTISFVRWFGILTIFIGVIFIGFGSKSTEKGVT
jgi:drug/metabolite transporter (DMT)-like permease